MDMLKYVLYVQLKKEFLLINQHAHDAHAYSKVREFR